jgi:hypothetical protein
VREVTPGSPSRSTDMNAFNKPTHLSLNGLLVVNLLVDMNL